MKKFILALLILSITTIASADFKVVYDKSSKEVIFIVDKGDVVISSEDEAKLETEIMSGKISDYDLKEKYEDYKMVNGRFIINTQKISDKENKKEDKKKEADDMKLIRNKSYKIACDALVADGVKFDKVKCSDFEQ